jgi:hypothetical protein
MNLIDAIYDVVIRFGISEQERQIEIARLKAARRAELHNIDTGLVGELARGSVRMKLGLVKSKAQHEAELAAFASAPPTPSVHARHAAVPSAVSPR